MFSTDDQIAKGVLLGDARAIAYLVEQYSSYVFTICKNILKMNPQSEEACQDTFMKAISKISDFKEGGSLKAWMFTIAYRTSIDYKRRIKYHEDESSLMFVTDGHQADETLNKKELNKNIDKLMSHLPEEDSQLIRLYYLNEMSIKEIVETTGLSESNIKVKLFRARKELASHIDKYFD
ncbi:MAG: hypothetical protein RLZZ546_215 [Bacteroidota bacterium]|jgi:RNA polymerase sigma-70 factor (ECF subfamily)